MSARLRIRTREHRGRFGDGRYPRVRNIAAAAVARDGQRQYNVRARIGRHRVIGHVERVRVGQRAVAVVRPRDDGCVRGRGIGNRIRGVVACLAVSACENGRPIRNGQIFVSAMVARSCRCP